MVCRYGFTLEADAGEVMGRAAHLVSGGERGERCGGSVPATARDWPREAAWRLPPEAQPVRWLASPEVREQHGSPVGRAEERYRAAATVPRVMPRGGAAGMSGAGAACSELSRKRFDGACCMATVPEPSLSVPMPVKGSPSCSIA